MQRCSCSLRALESFVHDLASLSIQKSKPRPSPTPNGPFSTRPRYRQIATSHVTAERSDFVLPLNDIVYDANSRPTQPTSKKSYGDASPLSAVDTDWHSDSAASVLSAEDNETRHDDFKSAEDVAMLSEGAEMRKMAKKMKGLEKKRRRKAEGVFGSMKRENEARKRGEVEEASVSSTVAGGGDLVIEDGGRRTRRERRAGRAGKESSAAAKTETSRRRLRNSREEGRDAPKVVRSKQRDESTIKTAGSQRNMSRTKVTATKSEKSFKAAPDREPKGKEVWQTQKASLERKFGEQGWKPNKRLSPDTLEGIRALHNSDPSSYKTETLAKHFQITPEAIRRILKSKWRPNEVEAEDRRLRWEKRGVKKWTEMAEAGIRPPSKWRALGVKSKVQLKKREKGARRERRGYARSDEGSEMVGESFAGRIL